MITKEQLDYVEGILSILEESRTTFSTIRKNIVLVIKALEINGVHEYLIREDPDDSNRLIVYINCELWQFYAIYNTYENLLWRSVYND